MTLKDIMKGMLFESVSNREINNAINNHKYVVIKYEGTDGTHNGKRMIQPVAFGLTSTGNPVVRAFEDFGDTKTSVPKWKYFRVDRISAWRETDKSFEEPENLFNPDDDKTMSIVYNIAKFGGNDELSDAPTSSPKKKSDENPGTFKTETERAMEKLRKQLKNPITLSDFKVEDGLGDIEQDKEKSGPKTNQDIKKNSDEVYYDDYNYNVFDNALDASGKKAKRNGHYYFQNRDNGKFSKGNVLDEPEIDDEDEIEAYLNRDNGNRSRLENLREQLGDISKPITLQELKNRVRKR